MPADHRPPRLAPERATSRPGEAIAPFTATTYATRRPASLVRASTRLQPRDHALALLLDDHRVLTTAQLAAVLFNAPRTCARRLADLRTIGFIDRFTAHRPGRRPLTCWVPGLLSARYAALTRGHRPPTPAAVRERQDATLASPQLAHTLGVNQFFIDLLTHARSNPATRLARWWPAPRAAAAVGRRISPDGHGIWRHDDREVGFWLEHDTGTEPLTRVTAKLHAYQRLHTDGGPNYPILFWLPTTTRETNLHRHLAELPPIGATIATAARDAAANPTQPVWLLATDTGRQRRTLADLPADAGHPGPYHPGPATPDDDPLHLIAFD
jgi:hypothetical protein